MRRSVRSRAAARACAPRRRPAARARVRLLARAARAAVGRRTSSGLRRWATRARSSRRLARPRARARGRAERRLDLGIARERGADDRSERERRRERDELHAAEHEAREQPDTREARVGGEPRRDDPRHPAASSDVLRRRRRHGLERLRDDVLTAHALHPELGTQRQPVRERGDRDRLHVLGHDEVASGERRLRARELQQREAAARARADGRAAATRASPRRGRRCSPRSPAETCTCSSERCISTSVGVSTTDVQLDLVLAAIEPAREHLDLVLAARVTDADRASGSGRAAPPGSGYVPSYSIGFCVASTMNGCGSGRVSPSVVTCRSCIASRSAACVFGGARLISSARRRLAKIGPGRNVNSLARWSKIDEPVTSEGIRSGVNWMREKSSDVACANDRAIIVFASPG